ncbi:MAG: hypothetical protein Q8891_08055 [Bacteroidota bacterium]|nr:hypothetical protein [Bacteroidota bacterium]
MSQAKSHKGLLGKVIQNFRQDTTIVAPVNNLQRNEAKFNRYEGFIIRKIIIKRLPFGIPFSDTTKNLQSPLTRLANDLHHTTKTQVVKNNLFFNKNDFVKPYLMADNERFLRQLPYLQDAEITVEPTGLGSDSVDVIVLTKDVFSLGGEIGSLGVKQSKVQMREDNFAGSGNAAVLDALYDDRRENNFAFGGEYIRRNIGGSYIDGNLGYQSFYSALSGPNQENYYFLNLSKPLINRYMQWVYELDLAYHSTRHLYNSDSVYYSDNRYRFYNMEAWAGYNINAKDFTSQQESNKLRKLIGVRMIQQKFQDIPTKYLSTYNWRYADLMGLLATLTFYRQNFYKTQFIYGFGRNEDIPEGLLLSITTGYTIKQNRSRPFLGFNFQQYHFNKKNNYIGYTVRAEGYLDKGSIEDINLLANINYFDHLKSIGTRWKQRFFLNLDAAQQTNTVLNEPLYLNSKFGLPEYGYNQIGGTLRATAKAESVFFSPWSLAAFKFAPFVFGNASVFSPYLSDAKLFSSIGGGIRTRNESFVFGTIEIRGFYFPQKNFHNESFGLELSTNVIFKYNTQFVKKPDFIEIN